MAHAISSTRLKEVPTSAILTQADLLLLCKEKKESEVRLALVHNPHLNIHCVDSDGNTPLIYACINEWKKVVELCRRATGINETINHTNKEGKCALFCARSEEIVSILLSIDSIDVNNPEHLGFTPFMGSIVGNFGGLFRLLLNDSRTLVNKPLPQNVIIDNRNIGGFTPLMLATLADQMEFFTLLCQHHRTIIDMPTEGNESAFTLACKAGTVEKVSILLTKNVDVNREVRNEGSGLMASCFAGHHGVVSLLLNNTHSTVKVNQTGYGNYNALIFATIAGHEECVKLLLDVPGIEVNHTAQYGITALAIAVIFGAKKPNYPDIAKLLRGAGAKEVNYLTWGISWLCFLNGKIEETLKTAYQKVFFRT